MHDCLFRGTMKAIAVAAAALLGTAEAQRPAPPVPVMMEDAVAGGRRALQNSTGAWVVDVARVSAERHVLPHPPASQTHATAASCSRTAV